jgi:hypothetical protein
MLAAETQSALIAPQQRPQDLLGLRHVAAERLCAVTYEVGRAQADPMSGPVAHVSSTRKRHPSPPPYGWSPSPASGRGPD